MDETLSRHLEHLTAQQWHLLRLLAAGATAGDLARRLDLSPRATRRAVAALLDAVGVGTVDEARLLWWGSRAGARAAVRYAARALVA